MKSLVLAAMIGISVIMPKDMGQGSQRREIELTGANTVLLVGDITPVMVDITIAAMIGKRAILPKEKTLYILIASPGGIYQSGLMLNAFISSMPNTQVICKACYSAAGMVFAASKQRRLAMDNSAVLMHEMYMSHITGDDVKDGRFLKQLVKLSDEFNKVMYTIMKVSKDFYEEKIHGTEWTVEGEDLVTLHLADEMVNVSCDMYMSMLAPDTCSR